MPRRAFIADLQRAKENILPQNTFDLRDGDEDGTFVFLFAPPAYPAVTIQAHVSDVGDYPKEHSYFLYTTSDAVPPGINEALSDPSVFDHLEIFPMIQKASTLLERTLPTPTSNVSNVHTFSPDEMEIDDKLLDPEEDESDDESWANDFDYDDDDNFDGVPSVRINDNRSNGGPNTLSDLILDPEFNSRIRKDLREVKKAGFRLACYGQLFDHGKDCYVVVSCRVAKLNIPEDTLRAWYLEPMDYILLIVHYFDGYQTVENLHKAEGQRKSLVRMHVGVSKRYKVTFNEVLGAFSAKDSRASVENESQKLSAEPDGVGYTKLRPLFIGGPLNELLNERLLSLMGRRLGLGCSWRGAEEYHQNLVDRARSDIALEFEVPEFQKDQSDNNLPDIVKTDRLENGLAGAALSFPLVAMQFSLRRLIQCTEYCLVCHRRTDAVFEALKPYVCSRPLCLYQYMALGFGPSLEHEILTQPHVVDLLVSFCYFSANCLSLCHLPQGMGLTVPANIMAPPSSIPPPRISASQNAQREGKAPTPPPKPRSSKPTVYEAKMDEVASELIFPPEIGLLEFDKRPVRPGDWVMIDNKGTREHRRVVEAFYPVVRLGPPVVQPIPRITETKPPIYPSGRAKPPPSKSTRAPADSNCLVAPLANARLPQEPKLLVSVKVYPYNQNFDDMTQIHQQQTISTLLGTLPSVTAMKGYLERGRSGHLPLRSWVDRISPAALGLLRWIIASNRSCIIQIDSLDPTVPRVEDRVSGMEGYMQFRFAQGAPDKEQRFITSVRETSNRLKTKQETLFAWHGSPLKNWHGIIREGLHYEVAAHGRAYGDGVYHALQANVSEGYSNIYRGFNNGYNHAPDSIWPSSELRVSSALCLNEIVNAPSEFTSSHPYLVVKQLDWIQTRYLFVKCEANVEGLETGIPSNSLELDPKHHPTGSSRDEKNVAPIMIPVTAVSKARRPVFKSVNQGNKKLKTMAMTMDSTSSEADGYLSDASDEEDVAMLQSDAEDDDLPKVYNPLKDGLSKIYTPLKNKIFQAPKSAPKTDFQPGTLDKSSLPFLDPPSYATAQATKALQRELRSTLKVQDTTPSHELGWYIDPEFDNMYQWIVELHSFDPDLPLAKDMKSKGIKSIVLELRFGSEYPYSPPFVRIITPRFLAFLQGGGGHVTAGGALCMELLTNSGWNPASSIESVLLQVRMAMTSTDPKPARLENNGPKEYSTWEAIEAYKRACMQHGWTVPKDFGAFEGPSSIPQNLPMPGHVAGSGEPRTSRFTKK